MITRVAVITFPRLVILIVLFSFAFIKSDCSKTITNAPTDITGQWELVKMQGDLQDVCLQEIAQFQGGTATLQCPGETPITRPYTFANGVLTYTSTGLSYNVTFLTENNVAKMLLQATNTGIHRELTYDQITQ